MTVAISDVTVINTERLEIRFWGSQKEWDDLGNDCQKQFRNLANHPLAEQYVCGMADSHLGFGMPIGGVLLTRGGVVPYAIGNDIGCGMVAIRTSLESGELSHDVLQKMRLAIHELVPVGDQRQKTVRLLPDYLQDTDGLFVTAQPLTRENAGMQLGTLGQGNHFVEVQADEEEHVWLMIHSGSRGAGAAVCKYYHNSAKDLMRAYHSRMPDEDPQLELAFIPNVHPLYQQYLNEMTWCMQYAEANRIAMLDASTLAMEKVLGRRFIVHERHDCHHNFAAMEHHLGKDYLVHRKGAVKAFGTVLIPGSMGTASYICRGLKPRESFNTCSHGAGRVLGRKQANKAITHEQAVDSMKHVVYGVREGQYDEMPAAYKRIERVIEVQADLIEPLHKLRPLAVVKG